MSNCVIAIEENEEKMLSTGFKTGKETEKEHISSLVQDKKCDGRTIVDAEKVDTKVERISQESQTTSRSEEEYVIERQWENLQLMSGSVSNSKQKHTFTQRMKLKEYNIKANDKANVRLPSYYKFDRSTTLIMQMLIDQRHSGDFHNVVGKGANSVVIHAHCYGRYHLYFPCGNAIKVYKLIGSVEKNNAIYKRVQREYEHLQILQEKHFSNNTPHPVQKNKNIIMMSFIGSDQETAPSITDLPLETLNIIYDEIVMEIKIWYEKLGLIHGNLSTRSILYWIIQHPIRMERLYYIGWSHSVRKNHPQSLKKLMKDCQFITTFFQSRGVSVKSIEDLFKVITGVDNINSKLLEVVHKDLWKDPNRTNPNRTNVTSPKAPCYRFK